MSEDMPSSWRYLTSAGKRISSFKGYISSHESGSSLKLGRTTPNATNAPRDERQSWRAWAGQKIRVRRKGMYDATESNELVNIFPGWAARRYASQHVGHAGPRPFELEVFVSGYAISYRSPANASRAQRAFIRLAKGFASLPKIVDSAADVRPNSSSFAQLTPSTEALLAQVKLPPRPTDITDDYDIDALERQLRRAKTIDDPLRDEATSFSSSSSSASSTDDLPSSGLRTPDNVIQSATENTAEVIKRLHGNLERRLHPFWSSALPNRVIRLHLFTAPHNDSPSTSSPGNTDDNGELLLDAQNGPLASQDVITGVDGSFQIKFNIGWEELCHHPRALHIAFGEAEEEHELLIVAQLLPLNPLSPLPPINTTPESVPLTSLTRIPVTYSPIRVISDIDDTVKFSGILSGARAVFHNVFVKDLRDNVIPGMGEWYAAMWSRGVRFHYVSNGPFELLPLLNEFLRFLNYLSVCSIKLRSYAGRSLFNGLLSAPAARKRAGVVDILDSFPDSRFFLIGDSGEQDLELYADIARERPDRILAVFVRDADANTFGGPPALEDPTGWKAMGAAGTRPVERPLVSRSESGMTAASTSTSYSKYNFSGGSIPDLRTVDANETPRPNNFGFDNLRQPSTASLDDKALAKARDQIYLGVSALSTEPESMESGDGSTPPRLSSITGPAIYVNSPNNSSMPRREQPQFMPASRFVDQPPRATPPPSVRSSLNLGPASAAESFRSQRTGSSASSGSSGATGKRVGSISDAEKKRNDLQMRVYRARTQMPSHIPLRIFRDPSECVEAKGILDRER